MIQVSLLLLSALFVVGLSMDCLNRALRRHERQVEAEWRRRALREVARHE